MRITTQMMNESARKAGLPINQTTLLDYINKKNVTTGNSLLDELNNKTGVTDALTADGYEKVEKNADNLTAQAKLFCGEKGTALFDKAAQTGDTKELVTNIEGFADKYNKMLSSLKDMESVGGSLYKYYEQMLEEAAEENSEALKKIGITIGADGKLTVNSQMLTESAVADMQAAFGSKATLSTKVDYVASKISDNAEANISSMSNQYDASGSSYSMSGNKFSTRG